MPALDPQTLTPPMCVTFVHDPAGLVELSDFLVGTDVLGFDVETNPAPSFLERKLRTVQIGNRDRQFVIDLLAFARSPQALMEQGNRICPEWAIPVAEVLELVLDTNKHIKTGFNLQFDYEAVLWNLGVYSWNLHDCMLAEKLLHAGAVNFFQEGFWGAEDIVKRYTGLEIDKSHQTSFNLISPLTQEQIQYAALDVRLPIGIRAAQLQTIDTHKLQLAMKIENDAIPAFGDMHLNGIKLSPERWLSIVKENDAQHADNVLELDKHFVPLVGGKDRPNVDLADLEARWRGENDTADRKQRRKEYQAGAKAVREWEKSLETFEGEAAINYGSHQQLLKVFRGMGINAKELPDTSDRSLQKVASEYPAVKALTKYRKTLKVDTTYGTNFVDDYLNPTTGRVHSRINQLGAATGRTTSSAPNIQNIPRGSNWRSCFVAEPGNKMITVDYNGCELRILAEASREIAWIEAFNKGWDVHSVGAEILFGEDWKKAAEPTCAYYFTGDHQKCGCKAHKKLRDQVKAMNFGIAYGMEASKLADSLNISKVEAQQLLDKYRSTFKSVTAYLKQSGETARMTLECRTLSGRRRLFLAPTPEKVQALALEQAKKYNRPPNLSRAREAIYGGIEREGKNTPIQGTNADMVKLAVGCGFDADGNPYLWHMLRQYNALLVNIVHDEVVVESPAADAADVYSFIGSAMQRAGEVFVKKIPMTYEGNIADEWSK